MCLRNEQSNPTRGTQRSKRTSGKWTIPARTCRQLCLPTSTSSQARATPRILRLCPSTPLRIISSRLHRLSVTPLLSLGGLFDLPAMEPSSSPGSLPIRMALLPMDMSGPATKPSTKKLPVIAYVKSDMSHYSELITCPARRHHRERMRISSHCRTACLPPPNPLQTKIEYHWPASRLKSRNRTLHRKPPRKAATYCQPSSPSRSDTPYATASISG